MKVTCRRQIKAVIFSCGIRNSRKVDKRRNKLKRTYGSSVASLATEYKCSLFTEKLKIKAFWPEAGAITAVSL